MIRIMLLVIINLFREYSVMGYHVILSVRGLARKSLSLLVTALSAAALLSASPAAAIENGSFETIVSGFPVSWESLPGFAFPRESWVQFVRPTDGDFMMQLETIIDYGFNTGDEIEEFLDLPTGSLNGLGNGSVFSGNAIRQEFTASPGDTVTFEWNFATAEEGRTLDFAFVSVVCPNETHLEELADAGLSTLPSAPIFFVPSTGPPEDSGFDHTGYRSFSITLMSGGTCRLGIGIAQPDSAANSILFVDNVRPIADPTALAECKSDFGQCESDLADAVADADLDGVIDLLDQCPDTMLGSEVDMLGCSLVEFCVSFDISNIADIARCNCADWKNDEPIKARDCKSIRRICRPR